MKRRDGGSEIVPSTSRAIDPFTRWAGLSDIFEDFLSGFPSAGRPALDIYEDKDHWYVEAEVPGLRKDDVKIEIEGDMLTISGERKIEEEKKGRTFYRTERRWGAFHRRLALPESVRADQAQAAFKDGVLTVTLPKKEEAKRKSISVEIK